MRNTDRFCKSENGPGGLQQRVSSGAIMQGQANVTHFQLNNHFSTIEFSWSPTYGSKEWWKVIQQLTQVGPDILIYNIGSNEICQLIEQGEDDVTSLALEFLSAARMARDLVSITTIKFMSVIKREKGCSKALHFEVNKLNTLMG